VIAAGLVSAADLIAPEPAGDEHVLRAHDADYLRRVKQGQLTPQEIRRIGLPWSPELVTRACCSVGGTIGACRAALQEGMAVSLAGADPYAGDRLGCLGLSKAGLADRDWLALHECRRARLLVAAVMAAGYGRQIEDTVEIHLQTVRIAAELCHLTQGAG